MSSAGPAVTWQNPLRDKRDKRLPRIAGPCAVVIFGVTGDLATKKLMPAIYDLANRSTTRKPSAGCPRRWRNSTPSAAPRQSRLLPRRTAAPRRGHGADEDVNSAATSCGPASARSVASFERRPTLPR
jgi:Glucose-6-phosphate dehydrogenase, NAD binding domain